MARYYITVILVNFFCTVFFYFRFQNTGVRSSSLFIVSGISVTAGVFFPHLAELFDIYAAVGINLVFIGVSTYFIIKCEYVDIRDGEYEAIEVQQITVDDEPEETGFILEDDEAPEIEVSADVDKETEVEAIVEYDEENEVEEPSVEDDEENEVEVSVEVDEETEVEVNAEENEKAVDNYNNEDIKIYETAAVDEEAAVFGDCADRADKTQGDEIMVIEHLEAEDNLELRDSFIERGFDAKMQGKLDLAIKYFTSALELNPPIDLQTMLVFDIHSMYREKGDYIQASECLKEFESRIGAELSPAVSVDVRTNLKYVEILREMLVKANTPNLPYSIIPALIKVSVDEKVNQWKGEIL